jgi:hypothetical protein
METLRMEENMNIREARFINKVERIKFFYFNHIKMASCLLLRTMAIYKITEKIKIFLF